MLRFRRRAPSVEEQELPPLKKLKHEDPTAKGPKRLASSIKRKTKSSAGLAKPRGVFGIFSKTRHHPDANEHTRQVSDKIAAGCEDKRAPPETRSMFAMFSSLSLKRNSSRQDNLMSGGHVSALGAHQDGDEASPAEIALQSKSQTFLQSARSRFSLKNREQTTPMPLIKVFRSNLPHEGSTIRHERGTAGFAIESLDPAQYPQNIRDSGYVSSDGDFVKSGGLLELEELPKLDKEVQQLSYSSPVDIPYSDTSRPTTYRVHSAESVGRIVDEELGDTRADATNESMLSTSPSQSIRVQAAIRPQSLRQATCSPDVSHHAQQWRVTFDSNHKNLPVQDKDFVSERYPKLLASGGTQPSTSALGSRLAQHRVKSGLDTSGSSHEMNEDDYARCVSQTPSVCDTIYSCYAKPTESNQRDVDIRSRRREDMLTQRHLAMDGAHGHVRSSTATAAEPRASKHARTESDECFSELDGETLRAIVNTPRNTSRRHAYVSTERRTESEDL
ncbi:MAG: hypothetical protein Q9162_006753 [Coniocarpon cinnabarinum]